MYWLLRAKFMCIVCGINIFGWYLIYASSYISDSGIIHIYLIWLHFYLPFLHKVVKLSLFLLVIQTTDDSLFNIT